MSNVISGGYLSFQIVVFDLSFCQWCPEMTIHGKAFMFIGVSLYIYVYIGYRIMLSLSCMPRLTGIITSKNLDAILLRVVCVPVYSLFPAHCCFVYCRLGAFKRKGFEVLNIAEELCPEVSAKCKVVCSTHRDNERRYFFFQITTETASL